MRESVFQKAIALILCGVLMIGFLPSVHVHAEEIGIADQENIGLTQEQCQGVLNRPMDGWFFPLNEEYFDDIVDFAGCRGGNEDALYGGANYACTHPEHDDSVLGNIAVIVNVSGDSPVYAPLGGTVYYSTVSDPEWGSYAVVEVPVDGTFSYYILLGNVSQEPTLASGSYVNAGAVLGSTAGEFRFAAIMDYSGMGSQIADDLEAELYMAANVYGWLTDGNGEGMICVNPSAYTVTQYPNADVSTHSGPITYSFVSQVEPEPVVTEPVYTEPVATEPIYTEPVQTEPIYTEPVYTEPVYTEPPAVEVTQPIATLPADIPVADIPVHVHSFDQQLASESYLAQSATCESPALYYYSCLCGQAGTETFSSGSALGHSFAEGWSVNEDYHWHASTCGHTDVTDAFAPHEWEVLSVISQPTHTAPGSVSYHCGVCGAEKTETIAATSEHVFDQQVTSAEYLASAATCESPATYYYSCTCGLAGTDTFFSGEALGHTYSQQWKYNESEHWREATCGHSAVADQGPHRWDDGMITVNAGHATNGEKVYTCQDCGLTKTEILAGQAHEYNLMVADAKYLVSEATCTSPAVYYKSCVCGLAGTETFTYGEAKGHTFSDQWSYNELQHWQAATCGHTDEKIKVADHIWSPGVVTTQPTSTTKGIMTYTCTTCGATRTEEIEPSTHTHTFSDAWTGNNTYHWHAATCGHDNVSGLGVHSWNEGVITEWATHTTTGKKVYTCTVCGGQKTETIEQTHTFDQMIASATYLKSEATCVSPAVYYKSCSCGAKGTETFTYGSALGHSASGTWGKDGDYHWYVCSRCGTKGDLTAHTYDSTTGKCTVCGYSKQDSHVHSSHLTRVPAKAATCTTDGNIAYYVCDCGTWFSDVTTNSPITDQASVVIPATGHVDADNNGKCDVCRERLDNVVEYQVTEGGEATWLNTSNQGMVFRSNAEYAKFDRVEVDGATVATGNYTVSEGSTVVELSASYLKRLSLGHHDLTIVAKDGKATSGFTIKQGASSVSSGNGIWGFILFMTVVVAIAIPVTFGVYYYRKKMDAYDR